MASKTSCGLWSTESVSVKSRFDSWISMMNLPFTEATFEPPRIRHSWREKNRGGTAALSHLSSARSPRVASVPATGPEDTHEDDAEPDREGRRRRVRRCG